MGGFGKPGMNFGGTPPKLPEDFDKLERPAMPNGDMPEGGMKPSGGKRPDDQWGQKQPQNGDGQASQSSSTDFVIVNGANMFSGVTYAK